MFQFQLLVDKMKGVSEETLNGMSDLELLNFLQSRTGERKLEDSILRTEKKIKGLKEELRSMHQKWIKKREKAKRAEVTSAERSIIHAKMSHIEDRARVIEKKVISEMLEEIHLLKRLLIDINRTREVLENGGSLGEKERKTIISALNT